MEFGLLHKGRDNNYEKKLQNAAIFGIARKTSVVSESHNNRDHVRTLPALPTSEKSLSFPRLVLCSELQMCYNPLDFCTFGVEQKVLTCKSNLNISEQLKRFPMDAVQFVSDTCINVDCQNYRDSFCIVELFMICNKLMMKKKFTSSLGINVSWLVMLIINQLAGLLM